MIIIDTDLLGSLSGASQNALSDIEDAMQILKMVTEHNDWGCAERKKINEKIRDIHKSMKKVFEDSNAYTKTLSKVAQDIAQEENSLVEMMESLDVNILEHVKESINQANVGESGAVWEMELFPTISSLIGPKIIPVEFPHGVFEPIIASFEMIVDAIKGNN